MLRFRWWWFSLGISFKAGVFDELLPEGELALHEGAQLGGAFGRGGGAEVGHLLAHGRVLERVLDHLGEAVHHVFPDIRPMAAGEYDRRFAAHQASGLAVALTGEVEGIGRHAFFDALDRMGCFIELLEVNERIWAFTLALHRAHQSFDGQRPIRPLSELMQIE